MTRSMKKLFWISLRIVLVYAFFGSLWIYFSDSLISLFLSTPEDVTRFQTIKGIAFIGVTSLLLYLYVLGELKLRTASERKHNAELVRSSIALKNSEDKFHKVFQTVPQMLLISDLEDNSLEDVNSRTSEIFSIAPKDIQAKDLSELSCFSDLGELLKSKGFEGAKEMENVETELVTDEGTVMEVLVWTRIIVRDGKKSLLWIIQDISREKRALREAEKALMGVVTAMGRIFEKRDPYTQGHQVRVAELAVAIAEKMGLSSNEIEGIRISSYIHDIGKIAIPAEILSKPSTLSEIEYGLIKLHPQTGSEFIEDIQFPWPVKTIIGQHHERLDGSGYPEELAGDDIHVGARILAVADVVEAMSSHRPYRPGYGIEAALEEIERQAGKRLDRRSVEACLELFREKDFAFSEG